jgi:hypothetical protein
MSAQGGERPEASGKVGRERRPPVDGGRELPVPIDPRAGERLKPGDQLLAVQRVLSRDGFQDALSQSRSSSLASVRTLTSVTPSVCFLHPLENQPRPSDQANLGTRVK